MRGEKRGGGFRFLKMGKFGAALGHNVEWWWEKDAR